MNQYPLVLLPGLAGSRTEFDAQVAHFAAGRPVYALDPFDDGDLTVDGQARRLAAALPRLTGGHGVIVGHSHGGLVALSLAAQRPDLVAGVVLLDTPVLLPAPARVLARLPLALLRTPLGRPAVRHFFAATFTAADPPAWRAEVMARLAATPPAAVRAVVGGTFTYDSAARLTALAVPALCVRANVPVRLDRLPGGVRGVELPGVGHWPHVHAPARTNDALEAFLATLGAQAAGVAGGRPGEQ